MTFKRKTAGGKPAASGNGKRNIINYKGDYTTPLLSTQAESPHLLTPAAIAECLESWHYSRIQPGPHSTSDEATYHFKQFVDMLNLGAMLKAVRR